MILSENEDLFQEYLKDFTLEFGYIEETPGLDKFDEPVIRNIVWNNQIRFNTKYLTAYNYVMAQSVVESTSGWFSKTSSSPPGLKLETTNFKMALRKQGDFIPALMNINGTPTRMFMKPYFFSIQIYLSNKIYTLQRVYQNFFDYLGNLGGVFEIMLFSFMLVLAVHHNIELELYCLNELAVT